MRILFVLALLLMVPLSAPKASAQSLEDVVQVDLRPGWRLPDGTHIAALQITLAPGWKTYWRSPGDAGIPPLFDWQTGAATNLRDVHVHFPAPDIFWQSGMRAVGYEDGVVFPLRVALRDSGRDAALRGAIEIGVCKDVCIPFTARVSMALPAGKTQPDPQIAAALASEPLRADDLGIGPARCRVAPMDGGMRLWAELRMPQPGGAVETVIETSDPRVWVADPKTGWDNGKLVAETRLRHRSGGPFVVDRSGVRITILRPGEAVDVVGCTG